MIWETKWKQIPGFEQYWLGDDGRVINLKFGRLIHPYWTGRGMAVNLWKHGRRVNRGLYKLAAEVFGME